MPYVWAWEIILPAKIGWFSGWFSYKPEKLGRRETEGGEWNGK